MEKNKSEKGKRNNHGSWARVGDFVELINPAGERTGIRGLVYKIETVINFIRPRRYVWVHGQNMRFRDSYVRIVSRGSTG